MTLHGIGLYFYRARNEEPYGWDEFDPDPDLAQLILAVYQLPDGIFVKAKPDGSTDRYGWTMERLS